MLEQLFTIARNTFTESMRQPILLVLVLLGAFGLILNVSLAAYTFEPGLGDTRLMIDLGLSTIFIIGILLSAFTATNVLSNELENRTVLTVISKPVARPVFVIGKYLGVAAAIAAAFYLLSLIFTLTMRHGVMQTAAHQYDMPVIALGGGGALIALLVAATGNYFYRWVFTSSFMTALAVAMTLAVLMVLMIDPDWRIQSPLHDLTARDGLMAQVMIGLLLVFQAVLILTAVAIAASIRLGQVMTLVVCIGVFLIGLISNSLSQWANHRLSLPLDLGPIESLSAIFTTDTPLHLQLFSALAQLIYLLAPNLQFLWPADAIHMGSPFSAGHVATVTAYSAFYILALLGIAVAIFQTREVG